MRSVWIAIVVPFMGVLAAAALAAPPIYIGQSDMTKAKAAADNYEVEKAVALYTKVIEAGNLTPQELAAAYIGRGEARANHATAYGIEDSKMLLALRDFQKARELVFTADAVRAEASVLIALGAYTEATDAYRSIVALEQPRLHWSLIGFARVERIQEHYDAALRHLDQALRIWGDEATMPIHFHRGRVLFQQQNFAAAADAFTKGLARQTDFSFAYSYRACAYAHTGEPAKALIDMEQSIKLTNAPAFNEHWEKTPHAKSFRQDEAATLAAIKAIAAGTATEADRAKLCRWTWNTGEHLRKRSPLLPGNAR